MHLSFVLLPRPYDADGTAIVAAHARLFPNEPRPLASAAKDQTVELRDKDDTTTFVALMPAPVPNGEAEHAARGSLAAFSSRTAPIPPHTAHLLVTTLPPAGAATVDTLLRHTRVVAAAAVAYGAVGIYEGNACATHPTAFYVDVVTSSRRPLMVWTGISVASENGRASVLTLGAENVLGIPDLLVTAPPASGNEALAFAFDMLGYVVDRGSPLPEGDTVGRSASEKITVRYVPSPVDETRRVVRLDLP
ncbi:MAG: DUF4261 domain-containing protein [Myxococcales bacterium]|nr:DUF4261 domain-containing protein [Myxococcales bacterium]